MKISRKRWCKTGPNRKLAGVSPRRHRGIRRSSNRGERRTTGRSRPGSPFLRACNLQGRRLTVAKSLPYAAALVEELQNFQVKVTEAANETFGALGDGYHDDLVLAIMIAAWSGENAPTGR